jgi:hypothetical protein
MDFKKIQELYSVDSNQKIIDLCFSVLTQKKFNNYLKDNNSNPSENCEILREQIRNLKEDIEELRTNYWKLHSEFIKKKKII